MSPDPRSQALSALARFQVTETTVGDTLNHIAEITLAAMPSAAIAGMTMLGQDGRPTTAVYTDPEAAEIDQAQYRNGKGPCLDAWRENRVVRMNRAQEFFDAYPEFTEACVDHGVRSTLSLPMVAGDVALGAMNLCARVDDGFDDDDEDLGTDLAAAAASVLANVSAYWSAFELAQQLNQAMVTRSVIEQAKGILMARSPGVSADEAFAMLRAASQRENTKLSVIAQRIVDRKQLPGRCEPAR